MLYLGGSYMPTNVGTATLFYGGYYMRGGLIAKGGLICQLIRYTYDSFDLITGTHRGLHHAGKSNIHEMCNFILTVGIVIVMRL